MVTVIASQHSAADGKLPPRMRENQHIFYMGERLEQKFVSHLRDLFRRSSCSESFKIRWWPLFKVPAVYPRKNKQTNQPTTFFLMDSRDLLWGETGHGSQLWPVFCKQFGKAVCKTRDTGVQGAQQTWKHQMLELPTLSWLMKCYQLVEPFQVTMTISFSRLWRIPAEDASLSSTDAHDLWPQFTLLTVVCNHSWATGQVHTKNTPLMLRGNGDDALPWGAWMGVVQITIISYRV